MRMNAGAAVVARIGRSDCCCDGKNDDDPAGTVDDWNEGIGGD